jgi:hypothetical protein
MKIETHMVVVHARRLLISIVFVGKKQLFPIAEYEATRRFQSGGASWYSKGK